MKSVGEEASLNTIPFAKGTPFSTPNEDKRNDALLTIDKLLIQIGIALSDGWHLGQQSFFDLILDGFHFFGDGVLATCSIGTNSGTLKLVSESSAKPETAKNNSPTP